MMGGAIGSEAISAAGLRVLASEWSGPRPGGTKAAGLQQASKVTRVRRDPFSARF